MLNTLGVVDVAAGCEVSRRGAAEVGRLVNRRLGGRSLLDWVLARVGESQQLDRVILLSDGSVSPETLLESLPTNVTLVVAPSVDPVQRLLTALTVCPAEAIVRVPFTQPFVDPELIDHLITAARAHVGYDYVGYRHRDGRRVDLSRIGLYGEWLRSATLVAAAQRLGNAAGTPLPAGDSITAIGEFVLNHAELFQMRLLPVPTLLDCDDLRLAVDCEADWDHAEEIYEALGPEALDWRAIAGLLQHHPAIRSRMADLNRAEA